MCEQDGNYYEEARSGFSRRTALAAGVAAAGISFLPGRGAEAAPSSGIGEQLHGSLAQVLRSPELQTLPEPMQVSPEKFPDLYVYPRSAWDHGDCPPLAEPQLETPLFINNHHSATPNDYKPEDVTRIIKGAYRSHLAKQAFEGNTDIFYNFIIDRFGRIFEARAGSIAGPVVGGATGGNQGYDQKLCYIGDFTAELPTPEALNSGAMLMAWLGERDGIDLTLGAMTTFTSRGSNLHPAGKEVTTATIAGHRDMSATACPGNTFYPIVQSGDFQARVLALRQANPANLQTPAPAPVEAPPTTVTTSAPHSTQVETAVGPVELTPPTTAAAQTESSGSEGFNVVKDGPWIAAIVAGASALVFIKEKSKKEGTPVDPSSLSPSQVRAWAPPKIRTDE